MVKKKNGVDLTGAQALEHYVSFHNRLSEWRELTATEQSRILRIIYLHCKKGVECLTPGCTTRLSTYNGMQYHLQHCGVPTFERKKQCTICSEQVKSGDMRGHLKRHAEPLDQEDNNLRIDKNVQELIDPNGKRRKRKSMLKANEMFAKLAAMDQNADTDGIKSAIRVKKVDARLEESDEEFSEENDKSIENDTFENDEEFVDPSVDDGVEKPKKEKDPKRHKKFTFLPDAFRQEFKKLLRIAFERIISEDYLKIGFSEWIIEKNSWLPLPIADYEPYVGHYKDKSHSFSWKNKSTEKTNLNLLDSNLSPYDGAIGYCGAPIVACAWCPIPEDHSLQYMAVSTHPNPNMVPFQGEAPGCIQFWSCSFNAKKCTSFVLEFLLAHNYGIVMDLRWCPSGIWQQVDQKSNAFSMPRLGALAMTSGTGEIIIYGIPHPTSLKCDVLKADVKIFKAQPLIVLYCGADLVSYTLDWSHFNGHENLAAGFHDGSVSIWNLKKPCELLRDSNNRLLTIMSLTVFKTPVRCLRWYSSKKILLCSMDRRISLWDVDDAVCLWTQIPQQFVVAVGCGPALPGYVTSSESSLQLPHWPSYTDVPSQSSIILTRYHQSVVWAFDASSWNGCVLSVDNQGFVCVSCVKAVDSQDILKRKFVETLLLRTICSTNEQAGDEDFVPKTWEEAKICSLQFSCEPKQEMKKNQLENEYKRLEISGHYPVAALFAVAWNPNRNYSSWCCFGGQAGLLFVCDTNM